jgi:hypothetical protein
MKSNRGFPIHRAGYPEPRAKMGGVVCGLLLDGHPDLAIPRNFEAANEVGAEKQLKPRRLLLRRCKIFYSCAI